MSKKVSIHSNMCKNFDSAVMFYFIFTVDHSVSNKFHFCEQNFQHFVLLVFWVWFLDTVIMIRNYIQKEQGVQWNFKVSAFLFLNPFPVIKDGYRYIHCKLCRSTTMQEHTLCIQCIPPQTEDINERPVICHDLNKLY